MLLVVTWGRSIPVWLHLLEKEKEMKMIILQFQLQNIPKTCSTSRQDKLHSIGKLQILYILVMKNVYFFLNSDEMR